VQQAGQAAKAIEQLLRQLQHALAGGTAAQQQGQKLAVAQRMSAACEQFLARSAVGRQVFQAHPSSLSQGSQAEA
jgi:hypothetical protein